ACDGRDLRRIEASLTQLLGTAIVEDAEKPILAATWACQTNLIVTAHVAVHGLPVATTTEPRWGRVSHCFQDGREPGLDLRWAVVKEILGRHLAAPGRVVDASPCHCPIKASQARGVLSAATLRLRAVCASCQFAWRDWSCSRQPQRGLRECQLPQPR